jgi:peroxiredoxin
MPAAEPTAGKKPPGDSPLKTAILLSVSAVALLVAGYYIYQQMFPANPWQGEISDDPRETNFQNATADDLLDLPLTDAAGETVSLRERVGNKHLVIVFTRGSLASVSSRNKGPTPENFPRVCAYCSSQVSGISGRLADFTAAEAEVFIVFPVAKPDETKDAAELLQAAAISAPAPFPVLYDLNLKAVDKLSLRAHLARPASFIVDKNGELRFAYVAAQGNADRPSAAELLRHLALINTSAEKSPGP